MTPDDFDTKVGTRFCICHVYYFPYQVSGWTGGLIVIVTQNMMSIRYIYIYSRFSKPKLIRQILIWNTEWKIWISHLIVLLL